MLVGPPVPGVVHAAGENAVSTHGNGIGAGRIVGAGQVTELIREARLVATGPVGIGRCGAEQRPDFAVGRQFDEEFNLGHGRKSPPSGRIAVFLVGGAAAPGSFVAHGIGLSIGRGDAEPGGDDILGVLRRGIVARGRKAREVAVKIRRRLGAGVADDDFRRRSVDIHLHVDDRGLDFKDILVRIVGGTVNGGWIDKGPEEVRHSSRGEVGSGTGRIVKQPDTAIAGVGVTVDARESVREHLVDIQRRVLGHRHGLVVGGVRTGGIQMQREGEGVRRNVVGRAVVVGVQGVTDGDIILAEDHVSAVGDRSRRVGREVGFLDGDVLQRHASACEEGDVEVVAVELVDEVGLVDIQIITLCEGGYDNLLRAPVGDLITAFDIDGVFFVCAAELGHIEDEVVPVVAFKPVGRKHHLVVEFLLGIGGGGSGASGQFPGKNQFQVRLIRAAIGPGLGVGIEVCAGEGGFVAALAGDGRIVEVGLIVEEVIGGRRRPAEVKALRTIAQIDADVVAVGQRYPSLRYVIDRPFYGVGDVEVHRQLRSQSLEGDVGRSHEGGGSGRVDVDVR